MFRLCSLFCLAVFAGRTATIEFTALPANTQFGTRNGYLVATINGQANQLLICDDFNHETNVPSGTLTYHVSTLTGSDPLEYARWNHSVALYQEAAFLLDGLNQTGPGSVTDLTAYYQYALWHLFTPTAPLQPGSTAQTLLDDAAASVIRGGADSALLYSRLQIYTPTWRYSSNQEFLQLTPAAPSNPWQPDGPFRPRSLRP